MSSGSACAAPPLKPSIFGGAALGRVSRLNAAQARSIARLQRADGSGLCTAIVVASGIALTARHCVNDTQNRFLYFRSGTTAADDQVAVRVGMVHDSLDVMSLRFEESALSAPVEPLVLNDAAIGPDWLNSLVEIAGVGQTIDGGVGHLLYVVEPVVEFDDEYLVVDGGGATGACAGDSGGPLFARADDGSVRVAGILSAGSSSCMQKDRYTRTDTIRDWLGLEQAIDSSCKGVGSVGMCVRGRAVWCTDGVLRSDGCATADAVCGWADDVAGFRCVAPGDDPCEGRGSHRSCVEGGVLGCVEGEVSISPCAGCLSCQEQVDENGAACL